MSAIIFSKSIGPVAIPVVVSEAPESGLSITEIPVEDGAKITDHAHNEPFRISLEVATETLAVTYAELVEWQSRRVPFTYVSGFAVHSNLLIKRIEAERTSEFGRVFRGRVDLQEVVIVSSASISGAQDEVGRPSGSNEQRGGDNRPGGAKSRRAAPPSATRAADQATKDRAATTVHRGDIRTNTVEPNESIAKSLGGLFK